MNAKISVFVICAETIMYLLFDHIFPVSDAYLGHSQTSVVCENS